MNSNPLKTVMITGASSGFGREFAKIFAKEGFNLLLVARDELKLQQLADELKSQHPPVRIKYISSDLAKQEAAYELYQQINKDNLQIDILINNAGVGEAGLFVDTDLQKELDIINVNVVSVYYLTKLLVREMVHRGEGKVLQVSSILGMIPTPRQAVYSATKAFVLSFSEALQHELKDTGVTMTVLCPGASDTEFFERANAEDTRIYQDMSLDEPAMVAQAGYEGLMNGKIRVVPGLKNKIQAISSNIVPDSLLAAAMSKLMEEK